MTDQERLDASWELWKQFQESLGRDFIESKADDYPQDMGAVSLSDLKKAYKQKADPRGIEFSYSSMPEGQGYEFKWAMEDFFDKLNKMVPKETHAIFIRKNPWIVEPNEIGVRVVKVRLNVVKYKKG